MNSLLQCCYGAPKKLNPERKKRKFSKIFQFFYSQEIAYYSIILNKNLLFSNSILYSSTGQGKKSDIACSQWNEIPGPVKTKTSAKNNVTKQRCRFMVAK